MDIKIMNKTKSESKLFIWIPIIFFLALFILDKLLLFPAVRKCCTTNHIDLIYQDSLNDIIPHLEEMQRAKDSGKKIAVNFGSSMSFGYYFLSRSGSIKDREESDSNLVPSESSDWYILNLAYPTATAVTHYVRFNQLLDRRIKPDLIMIEFSPATVNTKTVTLDEEIRNAMATDFVFSHLTEIPISHLWKNLSSRLILSLRYHPGISKVSGFNAEEIYNNIYLVTINNGEYNGPVSYSPGQESRERKFMDIMQLNVMKTLFMDYHFDKNLAGYMDSIIKRSSKEKIPLLLWNPKIHPSAQSIVYDRHNVAEWGKLIQNIENKVSLYIDFNDPNAIQCNQFIDTFHLGLSCFPEQFNYQIRSLNQADLRNSKWRAQ
jgi:hypothetical protein